LFGAWIARCVLAHRGVSAFAVVLVLGWAFFQLPGLQVDASLDAIAMRDDPDAAAYERAKAAFGSDELLMVQAPSDDAWSVEGLERLHQLDEALGALEGVSQVYSLANLPVSTAEGGLLDVGPLLERKRDGNLPSEVVEALRQDPFVVPGVVSPSGHSTVTTLRLRWMTPPDDPLLAKRQLVAQVSELAQATLGPDAVVAGWPLVETEMASSMERDAFQLTPWVLVAVLLVLWGATGRWVALPLALGAVGFSVAVTFAVVIATGHPITMVTNSLAAILIALTSAYGVHVLTHLFRRVDEGMDKAEALRSAITCTGSAIVLSSVTTAVGFGAAAFTGVEAIAEFGLFATLGALVSSGSALVVLPLLASVLPVRPRTGEPPLGRLLHPVLWLQPILAKRRWVLAGTAVLVAVSAWGWRDLRVETSPTSWFPDDHPVRQGLTALELQGIGMTPFVVTVPVGDGVFEPQALQRLDAVARWAQAQSEVQLAVSVAEPLRQLQGILVEGDPSAGVLPNDEAAAAQLGFLWQAQDPPGVDALYNEDEGRASVLLQTHILTSVEGVAFAERGQAWLAEHVPGAELSGSALVAFKTNEGFTRGLARTLSISFVSLLLVMTLLFRSLGTGAVAMIPNVIPIVVNYALLGWLGMALDAGTTITGCIAMGIAVDDTLHLLMSYRKHSQALGAGQEAMAEALTEVGPALVITSLCLSAGFGVLAFSSVLPIAGLGLLVSVTMLVCLLADLVLVPALLTPSTPQGQQLASAKPEPLG